ncbi:hypothetical protein Leryth_001023 [Lithospermum erythrorhizon]|nr:hypothetical protein Leryth_001023 [Lithospermum erythrorhizon]
MPMDAEGGRVTRRERDVEMREQDDSPLNERWGGRYDNLEEDDIEKSKESSKHRSKDKSKSSGRREEKDHRSKGRERSSIGETVKERNEELSKERRKADREERGKDKREKDADRDKYRDKDRDRRDLVKEKERERELDNHTEKGGDKESGKEKRKEKDRDREKDRKKEREKEKPRDRDQERETEKDRGKDVTEREKGKDRSKNRERETYQDGERSREIDRSSHRQRDENRDRGQDDKLILNNEDFQDKSVSRSGIGSDDDEDDMKPPNPKVTGSAPATSELEKRILKMKEERLQTKPESASEVLSWVNRSRKIEEKKALQRLKIFEEQDNIKEEESDDDQPSLHANRNLGGAKILHGLDKVLEGGAVVLTLKDQSILADGDVNQEVDMLENTEIGEQKRRDDAYKAAKKKPGTYVDKFNDDPTTEKKMLPQYDEPASDEGITLDASGCFTGDAERKLEELRKRLQGVPSSNQIEHLNSSGKLLSDYYTQEEMLQFKKPKKKKSLRKKEKLDLEALEAEAISSGLGAEDLGSRKDSKRQAIKEEKERSEAQTRSNAYLSAYAKAEEASKALRITPSRAAPIEEDETPAIGDDDEDLRKSLERARKLALKKQEVEMSSFPQVIAGLSSSASTGSDANNQNPASVEAHDNKLVFTEMEEFVWGLQLDEEAQKPDGEDVFMEEDETPNSPDHGKQSDEGWAEVKETKEEETFRNEKEENIVPDETIHESVVGKGLAGALKLLKDRGSLKETVEWGGRNTDKLKSKLVGIHENEGKKELNIDRLDEFGRILTPKEAFRLLSHKFHGKEPGKMKQEKQMNQYLKELKVKQMKNADTPSQSVEKMREIQAQLQSPYIVLSGHVKPGYVSFLLIQ